jgi:hypothetical protein
VPAAKTCHSRLKAVPCAILPEAADKFTAVVGLKFKLFHINATVFQKAAKYLCKQAGIGDALFVCKTRESAAGGQNRTCQICPASL